MSPSTKFQLYRVSQFYWLRKHEPPQSNYSTSNVTDIDDIVEADDSLHDDNDITNGTVSSPDSSDHDLPDSLQTIVLRLGLECSMSPSTKFQLYRVSQFYWLRKPECSEETTDLSQVIDKL
jgi:hypothetical protein